MSLRRPIVLASVVAAGTFAGAAYAYVCHPSVAGTRMLALRGIRRLGQSARSQLRPRPEARQRELRAGHLERGRAASRALWPPAARRRFGSRPRARRRSLAAGPAGQRVVVARGSNLQPDLLKVYGAGGALLRTLPLPARPQTLQSSNGIAVFSARGQGVFAVRLSDGLFGYLGPDGGAFAPRARSSRACSSTTARARSRCGTARRWSSTCRVAAIMRTIARTAKPLVTGGPIRSISMDGPRVAVAVGDNQGRCDRVLYWNVAWWPAQRVSAPSGVTCMVRPHGVQITSVAIGGFRAEWLVTQAGSARLIAGSPLCQEWVLGRYAGAASVRALAGDGATLVFATEHERPHHRLRRERPVPAGDDRKRSRHPAHRGRRLAGRRALAGRDGERPLAPRRARCSSRSMSARPGAIALQGNELVSARGQSPPGVRPRRPASSLTAGRCRPTPAALDLQDGVASFASGRTAVVLDTATGRTAVVGRGASRLTGVQIEGPGLAFAWTSGSKGVARFLTTRQVDVALGRLAA